VATLAIRADYTWRSPRYSSTTYEEIGIDTTTGEVVAVSNHEAFPEPQPGGVVHGVPPSVSYPQGSTVAGTAWVRVTYLDLWRGPCGLWGPRGVVGEGPTQLAGRCGRPLLNQPGNQTATPAGVDAVGGMDAYHLDGAADAWYNPALPFPVRVRDPLVDLFNQEKTHGWTFELTLTGYQPGAGAYPQGGVGGEAPRAALAPAPAGVPDEAGVQHPFPLSAAVAAARAQGAGDGYVGEAQSRQLVDQAGRSVWEWDLVLTDGHAHADRTVTYTPPAADLPGAQGSVQVSRWDAGLPADVTGLYPAPELAVRPLPKVADALAAFAAAQPPSAAQVPTWQVLQACFGDCAHPVRTVQAGIRQAPAGDPLVVVPTALEAAPYRQAGLSFRDDGTLLARSERTGTTDPATLLSASAPTPEAATLARVPRHLDAVPIALGAGTVAAGSLLLYAFWPALKGALGLFSRIETGDLLRHPVRARLHQLVESEPGLHFQELGRRAGVARGALQHHLDKLEAGGLLAARMAGGYRCYFLASAATPASAAQAGATRSEGAQLVLQALQAGIVGPRAIAAHTGLSVGTVGHHLKRLREAGLAPAGAE
jgi:DNA-binding transcriptional ArsR family regulator